MVRLLDLAINNAVDIHSKGFEVLADNFRWFNSGEKWDKVLALRSLFNGSRNLEQDNNLVLMDEHFFPFKFQVRDDFSKELHDSLKSDDSGSFASNNISGVRSDSPVFSDSFVQQSEVLGGLGGIGKDLVIESVDGRPRRELVPEGEILCEVSLQEQALTTSSLERLAAFGIDVGSQPHRDRSLPPRRVL